MHIVKPFWEGLRVGGKVGAPLFHLSTHREDAALSAGKLTGEDNLLIVGILVYTL